MRANGSYVLERADHADGQRRELMDPTTEQAIAVAHCDSFDAREVVEHARVAGVGSLQSLGFGGRGKLLSEWSSVIANARDELIEASIRNIGSTRNGAKFDVDGASATLAYYGKLGTELGLKDWTADREIVSIGGNARLAGAHLWMSRGGIAIAINAFNFPVWGFVEKLATAVLAGCPVINKPATSTALVVAILMEKLAESKLVPTGVLQQVLGDPSGLLEVLDCRDTVAFTGSGRTGVSVRHKLLKVDKGINFNIEADSLNMAVIGPDVQRDTSVWTSAVRDLVREMTEKTGQKCTATRRVCVPTQLIGDLLDALTERLGEIRIGDPSMRDVEMGPLSTAEQLQAVLEGSRRLRRVACRVWGDERPKRLLGVLENRGYFVGPMVIVIEGAEALRAVHDFEVFGPVLALIPYQGQIEDVISLARSGSGMLVSSVYSDDRTWVWKVARGIAPWSGRVCVIDSKSDGGTLPPGMVVPELVHGGPGRAGGGEELGGIRGVQRYMARRAFEGPRAMINSLVQQ